MRRITTIALAAILIPSVCFAWRRDGHRITGYIAANYLTPQAAAAVKDLLGDLAVGAIFDDDGGPAHGAVWVLFLDGVPSTCPADADGRVTICHIPPGNPDNAHTITVGPNAVPAHLAHGDLCGPCEEDDGLLLGDKSAAIQDGCSADLDDSGDVGAADLAELLGAWGRNPGHPADLDGDGDVGSFDLALLLGNWGPCP